MKFLVVEICEQCSIRTDCVDSRFSATYEKGLKDYNVTPELLEDLTLKGVLRFDGIEKQGDTISRTFILVDSE